jgi:hypothetical protein
MALHLHGRIGPYGMLLTAGMVLEVWPVPAGENSGAVHLWRGRALPLIDARRLLGLPPRAAGAPAVDVAYGARVDDPKAVVLALDEVAGVADLATDDLYPLPRLSAAMRLLFDAVTAHRDGVGHLLRLRAEVDFDAVRTATAPAASGEAAAPRRARNRKPPAPPAEVSPAPAPGPASPPRRGRSARSRARAEPQDPG